MLEDLETYKKTENKNIRNLGTVLGLTVIIYIAIQIFLVNFIALKFPELYALKKQSSLYSNLFTVIIVDFICLIGVFGVLAKNNKNRIVGNLVPREKIGFVELLLWVSSGMLVCIISDIIVGIIIMIVKQFGYQLTTYETIKPSNLFEGIMAVILTALIPAICEEFALRCCCLGMLKKYGKPFAVITVSIIFGLLHGNIIQFIFATLVGLVLAYVTLKTNNILPAIIIHFFNNSMSAIKDIVSLYINDTNSFVMNEYYFWIIVGTISMFILVKKEKADRFLNPRNKTNMRDVARKVLVFFTSPVFILSICYLVYKTATSFEKI